MPNEGIAIDERPAMNQRDPVISRPGIVCALLTFALIAAAAAAHAAPAAVDGVLGAEWSGVPGMSMKYDGATPGAGPSYTVYYRSDATHLYGAVVASGNDGGMNFTNLYFDTNMRGGWDVGIDLQNQRAFVRGAAGTVGLQHTLDVAQSLSGDTHVLEWSLPWNYFSADPDEVVPDDTNVSAGMHLRSMLFRSDPTLGSLLVGGSGVATVSQPAPPRVGEVAEPSTALLALAAFGMLGAVRRRRIPTC